MKASLKIGVEHLVPLLACHLLELRLRKNPGIGAKNVDAAMVLCRFLRGLFHLPELADIGGKTDRSFVDLLCRGSRFIEMTGNNCYLCACIGEDPCDPLPYSLGSAGDEHRASFKRRHSHSVSPRYSGIRRCCGRGARSGSSHSRRSAGSPLRRSITCQAPELRACSRRPSLHRDTPALSCQLQS